MPRIQLIVTGNLEKLALAESLQRLFPRKSNGKDVVWEKPHQISGTTSHRLPEVVEPRSQMAKLARTMLAYACVGKQGSPADLVVAVDDVELGNLGREHLIVAHLRSALESELSRRSPAERALLRERCSFHLLRPMVEAYFFGDPNALYACGVPTMPTPKLVHATDVEEFETDDPAWLPTCAAENRRQQLRNPWWRHERHPKAYLEHLVKRVRGEYRETKAGRSALQALRWEQVPKLGSDAPLIRSLFADLADWFGVPNPLGAGVTDPRLYPQSPMQASPFLLRNI